MPKDNEKDIPSIDLDSEEGLSIDEALAKVAMLLAFAGGTKDPRVLSEISEEEIKQCASLYVVAEKMEDKMLASFLLNFLMLRVSKKRKGRDELLQIARSAKDAGQNTMGRMKALFSGMR